MVSRVLSISVFALLERFFLPSKTCNTECLLESSSFEFEFLWRTKLAVVGADSNRSNSFYLSAYDCLVLMVIFD